MVAGVEVNPRLARGGCIKRSAVRPLYRGAFPNGGSLGGMIWFELCAVAAEPCGCVVSLLSLPFPKGGSLGGMLWCEVCAIAPTENMEVSTAVKRNFFTIFSEVFRLHRIGQCIARASIASII